MTVCHTPAGTAANRDSTDMLPAQKRGRSGTQAKQERDTNGTEPECKRNESGIQAGYKRDKYRQIDYSSNTINMLREIF
jgi:hypothetical protein